MTNRSKTLTDAQTGVEPGVVLIRFGVLLVLLLVAFRQEWREMVTAALDFSEWSHTLALPVAAVLFVLCRKGDIREALTGGSSWGFVLILAGLGFWFASTALSQFGYLRLLGLLACLGGVIWAAAGRRVVCICLPMLLATWLCLPLSERTVESKSLALQRWSLQAAATPMKLFPGVETHIKRMTIAYERAEEQGIVGLGEQRFSLRLIAAGILIGLFTVFCRRRPGWQIAILTLACLPIVFFCNILRMTAWVGAAVYGGFEPVSTVPRNVSIVAALVGTYGCFALGCWVLPRFGSVMERVFTVEVEEDEEE